MKLLFTCVDADGEHEGIGDDVTAGDVDENDVVRDEDVEWKGERTVDEIIADLRKTQELHKQLQKKSK